MPVLTEEQDNDRRNLNYRLVAEGRVALNRAAYRRLLDPTFDAHPHIINLKE